MHFSIHATAGPDDKYQDFQPAVRAGHRALRNWRDEWFWLFADSPETSLPQKMRDLRFALNLKQRNLDEGGWMLQAIKSVCYAHGSPWDAC
jgi:hypothetical protein